MTHEEATAFAAEWTAAWNELAIERVLAHFVEDVEFTSPTAVAVVGVPVVRGKAALRAYWQAAVARIGSLKFAVDRLLWDPQTRELAIIYVADIDGKRRRVSENMTFGAGGQVVRAEVFHGVGA